MSGDFSLANDRSNLFKLEYSTFEQNTNVSAGFLDNHENKQTFVTNVTVRNNVFQSAWINLKSGGNISLAITNVTFEENRGLAVYLETPADEEPTFLNIGGSWFINGTSKFNASVIQIASTNVEIRVTNSTFQNNKAKISEIFCISNETTVYAIHVTNMTTPGLTNDL